MKRIIMHWTAGADGVNDKEQDSYHFLVERDGNVVRGDFQPEDNIPPLRSGRYAAHTLNCNSYSIGVALDAMAGAQESPFNPGDYPITNEQLDSMVVLVAELCGQYGIPVTRETVLTHAEVQPTLGIKQNNKWDISWLPGMTKPAKPGSATVAVGDALRTLVQNAVGVPPATPVQPTGGQPVRPVLRIGARGQAVVALQTKLMGAGYDLHVDGIFGPMTYSCLRWFQAREGLYVDGIAGPKTWAKLDN